MHIYSIFLAYSYILLHIPAYPLHIFFLRCILSASSCHSNSVILTQMILTLSYILTIILTLSYIRKLNDNVNIYFNIFICGGGHSAATALNKVANEHIDFVEEHADSDCLVVPCLAGVEDQSHDVVHVSMVVERDDGHSHLPSC